jgi:SAM-dependent methyltransferase
MNDLAGKIVSHYERHALAWDADRQRSGWIDRKWHDRFIALLNKQALVLDLGCGGRSPVASNLVTHGLRVTGVDSSPTLISLCRSRLPDQEWIVADMRNVSLARSFNGILAWDSFFHLSHDDQRGMFAVFAAHSAPDAILMFNTGPAYGEAIGGYRGDALYHASLDADEYRQLLTHNNFNLVDHSVEDLSAGGRTVWVARATMR